MYDVMCMNVISQRSRKPWQVSENKWPAVSQNSIIKRSKILKVENGTNNLFDFLLLPDEVTIYVKSPAKGFCLLSSRILLCQELFLSLVQLNFS